MDDSTRLGARGANRNGDQRAINPLDKVLPHALDAERAVLGSMLLDESAIPEAVSILQDCGDKTFWSDKHQRLYDLVVSIWQRNRSIDGVVLRDELERSGEFDSLGGYEFLGGLINSVPSALRIREYANITRDKALLRQVIRAAHKSMEAAYADNQPTGEIMDLVEREIFDVTERRVSDGAASLPDLIQHVFEQIQDLDGSVLTGLPSGYFELDEMTCGLQPGELIIVAARPSMGKTTLGMNMAEHMAIVEGFPVLFFSLEMSAAQVAQRILCSQAGVDAQKLRRGRHNREDLSRLMEVAERTRSKPLFIDDTSSLSILELRARARMAYRRHKIRAIFVDYLQLMSAPGSESRQQEVASISRGLKALAKDLGLPVVAMAQLNRNPEDRSHNRPRMSDLRESGAIEQDADVIALLHRESYYRVGQDPAANDDTTSELIIAKQRNGPVGTIELHFDRRCTRFTNPHTGGRRYADTQEAQGESRSDMTFPPGG